MLKNIAVLCITVVILIILAEISLWIFFPIEDPYGMWKREGVRENRYIESQFQPYQHFLFYSEPGLPGMAKEARFTTNNLGFRGSDILRPKPPDEFRIFMVGGSTTECLYLDDTLSLTHIVQSNLDSLASDSMAVRVYGAGKSGDRSYDHIAMISQRITHLEPDLILVFCGMNDLTAAIYDADYLQMPQMEGHEYGFFDMTKFTLTEFQLPRRLYYVYKGLGKEQLSNNLLTAISFKSDYKSKVALRRSCPETDMPPRIDLPPYRDNLLSIIGLARAHNIGLVFMTQATTWNSAVDPGATDWIWGTYKNGVTYREDLMDKALTAYNDVMRDVAARENVPVFDLASLMPKSLEYFYDDCHFNINGSRKAGALLSVFLMDNGLIRK